MPGTVNIESSSLAACCCAALLARSGTNVQWPEWRRTASPTILLNGHTLRLLKDVFGFDAGELNHPQIVRRRVVQWQPNIGPATFPHFGIVVDQSALLSKLWRLVAREAGATKSESIKFSIRKTSAGMHTFGSRKATATIVRLQKEESDACWMEAMKSGWLFLMPRCKATGILLAVGSEPATLLAESRLVARQIVEADTCGATFGAMPRIADPLFGTDWLVCGGNAMSFDPICGEGAGNALREGILASAVIREHLLDNAGGAALEHYASRLFLGFQRHLQTCLSFYQSAYETDWWGQQEADLQRALAWTNHKTRQLSSVTFRLEGFDLVRTGRSATAPLNVAL